MNDWSPAGVENSAVQFPLRVSCIDAGSNGLRFSIADFSDSRTYRELEYERVPVRLGHEVFLSGQLSPPTMEAAIAAFRDFRRRMDEAGVRHYRAVATSAVRDAKNGPAFIERVHEEADIDLHTIRGSEEARLVYLAVAHRVPLGVGSWILVDLGGGSVEVSLVDADDIRWAESHTMGSVRLLEELTSSGEDPGRFLRLLEEYASTLRIPKTDRIRGYLATGGNIETLAKLGGAIPDPSGISRLPMADLRRIIELLARMSYRQRVDEFGLKPDRADVVLPAGIIYERLGKLIGAAEIVVPHVGVKEGLLLDVVEQLRHASADEDRRDHQVVQASIAIGRKYQFDEAHALHVAKLSLSVFDQTVSLHGLGPDSRRILHAAALLHEIGSFISRSEHHKHSLYLITHSEIAGLDANETLIAANVARYHRKSGPKPEHEMFQQLSKPDRQRTAKLAALLRLSDSLDREHAERVSEVRVHIEKSGIRLSVCGRGDMLLEGWSLMRRADLFREVFRTRVTMDAVPEPA